MYLDPEHVDIKNLAQDFELALGLGVGVEIEQQLDIRAGALADRRETPQQIAQHPLLDIELEIERHAKAGPPGMQRPRVMQKGVGLEAGEAALPRSS